MSLRAGCFPCYHLQYGHAGYVSLCTSTSLTWRVNLFRCQQHWGAVIIALHRNQCGLACRVYPFQLPAVWTCRVFLFPPAVWMCRVYPFPQPAIWICRVCFAFHYLQYVCAECISLHHKSWMGVISTISSVDVQCCIPFYLRTVCLGWNSRLSSI